MVTSSKLAGACGGRGMHSDEDKTHLPADGGTTDEGGAADESPKAHEDADRRPTDPSISSLSGAKGKPRSEERAKRLTQPPKSEPVHPPADLKDEHVGKVLQGKYRIDKLVAKGGMGRVYRGTQFPLERTVAIKILNKEFQRGDPQFVRRFFLEAATAAKLSHPHTITVFDYGESDTGDLYIAMEYLRGRPLSKVIAQDGPFDAERALRIALQVARALREAHGAGVIHRDLKPGNIFLVDEGDGGDYAKVLDFGLVKLFRPESPSEHHPSILGDADADLTRTGTLLGSPKYMSPEQIQGHALDPRTDIYSFGVILFQMMAGKPPFTGATGVDVIYKHVHQEAPVVADVAPQVECPAPVEHIIQRCLAKKREDRFASMDELLLQLKDALRLVTGVSVSGDALSDAALAFRREQLASDRVEVKKIREQTVSTRPVASEPERSSKPSTRPRPASQVPPAEARFRDPLVEEPTPVGQAGQDRSGEADPPRPSRTPLLVSMAGFLVAVATLGYVLASLDDPPQEPGRFELRFRSEPAGAQVFDGEAPLGTTPFSMQFEVQPGQRRFTFRQPGYKAQVQPLVLDGRARELTVVLEREPPPPEPAAAEPMKKEPSVGAVEERPPEDEDEPQRRDRRRRTTPPKPPPKRDPNYRQNPY